MNIRGLRHRASTLAGVLVLAASATAPAFATRAGAGVHSAAASGRAFAGIACTSTSNCFAVGSGDQALIERYANGKWSIMSTPKTGAKQSALVSVKCGSTTSCFAVGTTGSAPKSHALVEHWDGHHWAIQKTATVSGNTEFSSVTCAGTSSCVAVGTVSTTTTDRPLVEHWNGHTWKVQKVASPKEGTLSAVACVTATNCYAGGVAYGPFRGDEGNPALVEHWNGKSWTVQDYWTYDFDFVVHTISCAGPNLCALGGIVDGSPFIQYWDGHTWSDGLGGVEFGGDPVLGVRCEAGNSCWTVGYNMRDDGNNHNQIGRYDGNDETIVPSPVPAGSTFDELASIACQGTSWCEAVGFSSSGALAEHWNGHTWSIQSTPNT